jgi:hypothetical protein
MEKQMLLIGYDTVDFQPETGDRIQFKRVYLLGDQLHGENKQGYKVMEMKLPITDQIKEAPALVNCQFEMDVNRQQAPVLKLKSLQHASSAPLFSADVKK